MSPSLHELWTGTLPCVCQKKSRLLSAAESHTRKCKNLVKVPKVDINQPEINGEFETQESAKTTCKPT